MNKRIPYGRQSISNVEKKLVIKTLSSDFLTQGPLVKKFESLCSDFLDSNYALAFNSASSALLAVCKAINIGKNDEVWTSPNTFVATANCVLNCGAKIDFVDINDQDFCIDLDKLELKLFNRKKNSLKLPKAIILVHFAGFVTNLSRVKKLSKIYKFKIIEDASHAFGSKYDGKSIGNCEYSDVCIFSFHPVKIITTGEGGLVTTNSKTLFNQIKLIRDNGINRDKHLFKNKLFKNKPWYYEQLVLGCNYRMSDIHAAVGLGQIKKIRFFLKRRQEISRIYKKELASLPIRFQNNNTSSLPSYHLFVIRVNFLLREKLFQFLRKKNIFVNLHYIPIYRFPYYKKFNFKNSLFPNMESYFREVISLPIFPDLKKTDQLYVIRVIKNFFKN